MAQFMRLYTAPAAKLVKGTQVLICMGQRDGKEKSGMTFIALKKGKLGPAIRYTDAEVVPYRGPINAKVVQLAELRAAIIPHPAEVVTKAGSYLTEKGAQYDLVPLGPLFASTGGSCVSLFTKDGQQVDANGKPVTGGVCLTKAK